MNGGQGVSNCIHARVDPDQSGRRRGLGIGCQRRGHSRHSIRPAGRSGRVEKAAAFQAAGPVENESAGKIACPTSDAFPWGFTGRRPSPTDQRNDRNPLLTEAARQLRAYFAGQLREFQLPLDTQGTDFQKRVWERVAAIPYGETVTLFDLGPWTER